MRAPCACKVCHGSPRNRRTGVCLMRCRQEEETTPEQHPPIQARLGGHFGGKRECAHGAIRGDHGSRLEGPRASSPFRRGKCLEASMRQANDKGTFIQVPFVVRPACWAERTELVSMSTKHRSSLPGGKGFEGDSRPPALRPSSRKCLEGGRSLYPIGMEAWHLGIQDSQVIEMKKKEEKKRTSQEKK